MRGVLLAGLLVLAACSAPPEPATGASTVVLRAEDHPGFAPHRYELPEFTLYGDGQALVADGHVGALPKVRSYQLTRERVRALFGAADDAGLFADRVHDLDGIADGGALEITLRADREYVTKVVAPSGDDGGSRGRALRFRNALTPDRWPRADFTADPARYEPGRLAVFFLGRGPGVWEGAAGWAFGGPERCQTLEGELAEQALALAVSMPPDKLWHDGKQTFTVVFRPLLPDETDCEADEY